MTLDDFFTLTEINNGFTAPSRVRELVAVMVNEKECIVKNVGDATRQWSAVASAITATENKSCLDLFIQLDGLQFIDKWLKDAQKFSNGTSDSFVEESITHLLQALEKLHADKEKLLSSDIWTTVKNLHFHNSSKVQDKARVLFESWETQRGYHASFPDVEKVGALTDDGMGKGVNDEKAIGSEYCLKDASLSSETSGEEKVEESVRDDPVQSTSSDAHHPGPVDTEPNLDKICDPPVVDNRPLDHNSSPSFSNPAIETPVHPATDNPSAKLRCPDVSRHNSFDGISNCQEMESISDVNDNPIENSPHKLELLEESKISEEISFPSSSDAADAKNLITEHTSLNVSVSGDKNLCGEGLLGIDSTANDSDGKGSMSDGGYLNQRPRSSTFNAKEGGEFYHHVLWNSCSGEKRWENSKDSRKVPSQTKDDGKNNKLDLHFRDDILPIDNKISNKEMDREHHRSGKKSDVDLDYGIVDPLEVARQVAIEVEREVVDYTEQSCSSEKLPEGNIRRPGSPDSVSGNKSHASDGSPKDAANDLDLSAEASSMQEESATSSEDDLDAEQTNGTQDMETSQVTEASQEDTNQERGKCNFDLNIDACSEDADLLGNQFSTPVSVVSASRAAAAPGLPVSPLQFEGNLGWKGSAATSAFRPASSRRMPENDKDHSTGGSSNSSKQRQGLLDIDLNVAESGDDRIGDLSADKQVPATSSLPSGESSVEMNSRSEHLELDLNLASEDGDMPTIRQTGQLFPCRNVHHSRSNSSSSSSKQPSLKHIDLNDHPSIPNDSFDNSYLSTLSQNFSISGGIKSDDSVISIMGTRVEVNRKDSVSQTMSFSNGRTSELAFDVNLGRTGSFLGIGSVFPYTHSSIYGYNNIAPASAMPFSSTIYGPGGPIPYMVDSRGAPIVPQIVAPASTLPTAFSQPPFVVNMTSSTPSNGVGSSRSSFELNSRTVIEGGNRDPTSLGLFSGHVNSQPAVGSVIGGKRKEPDNGWEHYPLKPYTPPWI